VGRRTARIHGGRSLVSWWPVSHVSFQEPPRRRPYVALTSSRFGPVYRRGERVESGGVLVIRAAGESGPPQVGIVAGRNVGNAVLRNRIKRRLREAMSQIRLQPDTAYIVVASSRVAAMPFGALVDRLSRAIARTEEIET